MRFPKHPNNDSQHRTNIAAPPSLPPTPPFPFPFCNWCPSGSYPFFPQPNGQGPPAWVARLGDLLLTSQKGKEAGVVGEDVFSEGVRELGPWVSLVEVGEIQRGGWGGLGMKGVNIQERVLVGKHVG